MQSALAQHTTRQRKGRSAVPRLLQVIENEGLRFRVQTLFDTKIEFIDCDDFHRGSAARKILVDPPNNGERPSSRMPRIPKGLTPFLASLYSVPLLTPAQERDLFRRWNYLKYRAYKQLWRLTPGNVTEQAVWAIEQDLVRAAAIKNRIVQANLRLVVSIAKKFLDGTETLHELVSDGILSLMRAAEKFDYSRGYKFSTYATYAIRRNFFRAVIQRRKQRTRFVSGEDELYQLSGKSDGTTALDEQKFHAVQNEIARALGVLSEREQTIISMRFGIASADAPMTLQEIASQHGVCKERIRQIQTRAIEKLHQVVASKPALREIVQ